MPIMEVVLHLPQTQDSTGGRGKRGDPGEWQNPTASPHGHDEDDDDETLLHARKGTLLQTLPGIFTNATTVSLCMQPPNPA